MICSGCYEREATNGYKTCTECRERNRRQKKAHLRYANNPSNRETRRGLLCTACLRRKPYKDYFNEEGEIAYFSCVGCRERANRNVKNKEQQKKYKRTIYKERQKIFSAMKQKVLDTHWDEYQALVKEEFERLGYEYNPLLSKRRKVSKDSFEEFLDWEDSPHN